MKQVFAFYSHQVPVSIHQGFNHPSSLYSQYTLKKSVCPKNHCPNHLVISDHGPLRRYQRMNWGNSRPKNCHKLLNPNVWKLVWVKLNSSADHSTMTLPTKNVSCPNMIVTHLPLIQMLDQRIANPYFLLPMELLTILNQTALLVRIISNYFDPTLLSSIIHLIYCHVFANVPHPIHNLLKLHVSLFV